MSMGLAGRLIRPVPASWHVGEGPDRRSVRAARNHGIDISKQICRQFKQSDFDEFDHIFVMDKYNLSDVLNMARNDEQATKK
jgi:protein-tyrosine phosphatase